MRTAQGALGFGHSVTKKLFQKNFEKPLDKPKKVCYN